MVKSVDRQHLAYIKAEDSDQVVIDVVKVSRNGLSYHYLGSTWNRNLSSLNRYHCTDKCGRRWKISPLSRHYRPPWVEHIEPKVTPEAKKRCGLWLARKLQAKQE